ncbi:class I SAM-dependent methyltransferase [Micrococcus sp.]|uniref:class I SAM-dependent methyltransferase n=1 Tax=Micrococcus sp. TaxID=1271 RepID=UPI0026DC1D75|nr:methyltransferase [Micrococcus sp.]MDO4240495.1 methyltransferase [Micrococcus sp.]
MTEPPAPGRTPDVVLGGLPEDLTADVDFAALSRWPLPAENGRQAHDAADLLLLDTLAGWAACGHRPGPVAVLEDRHGALTLPLLAAGHPVRVHQDDASAERSLDANLAAWRAAGRLGPEAGSLQRADAPEDAVRGVRTVLLPLPRSLDELDRLARLVARQAEPEVVLLAGGRDKHMSPRMNAMLGAAFEDVVAGRGRRKARVLTARGPRPGLAPRPAEEAVRDVPGVGRLRLVAHAGTFGGAAADPGSLLLLTALAADARPPGRVVDLGCGNGLLSVGAARLWPHVAVTATDQSAVAVASTLATARANGVADRVRAVRDDALATWADGSEECVLLNPPFHDGNAVDPSVAHRLVAEAARVLSPGGRLWCVWNSHLRYRPVLEDLVGPTRQVARDRTFTVTVSSRR